MTILEVAEKLKRLHLKEFLVPTLIVLVGIASFCLGRLSVLEMGKPSLSISYPENYERTLPAAAEGLTALGGGAVVASKNGTRYFYPDCSGAKGISESNRVSFPSAQEARKAGYLPAAHCNGLQ